jgi:uncharacterized membrane protein
MNAEQWKKVAKGAGIAAVGAIAGYVSTVVLPLLENSTGAVALIAPLVSVVVNIVLKMTQRQQ